MADYPGLLADPSSMGTGGLLGSDPTTLGLALMSAAGPSPVRMPIGAALGQAGLQAQQLGIRNTLARTQIQSEQQRMMMERLQLEMAMRRMGFLGAAFGAPGGATGGGAPQQPSMPSAPGMGLPNAPAASPIATSSAGTQQPASAPQAQASGSNPYSPMTEADIERVSPIPQVSNVDALRAYEESDWTKDPIEQSEKFMAAQRAIAARQQAPVIAQLDNIMKADHPAAALQGAGNEQLRSIYPQLAQTAGLSPTLTDRNVQLALTSLRNRLTAPFGQAAQAPPTHYTQQGYGVGGLANIDQNTGEVKSAHGEVETSQFVDPTGKVVLLPKGVGMARGYAPFDSSTYVNQDMAKQMGHLLATYTVAPPSGRQLNSAQSQANLAAAQAENPSFDATKFEAKSSAMRGLASGDDGKQITAMSTAVQHLAQLKDYAAALKSGNIQRINSGRAELSEWLGDAVPAKVELVGNIAAEEVNKVAVGGPGAEGDRDLMRQGLDMKKASPAQVAGNIDASIGIMGAKIAGIKSRVTSNLVGINGDDFDTMLTPEARAAVKSHGPQAVAKRTYNPATGRIE